MTNKGELGNQVTVLQEILRILAQTYHYLPQVPLDGIFGETTLEAVLLVQKELFPPVTGVVNQEFWEKIRGEALRLERKPPRVLRAFPEGEDSLDFGDERAEIALFQMMFQLLGAEIAGIETDDPSGLFTKALERNIAWLQGISGLPVTGRLDRESWDRLARLYEIFVTA